MTLSRKRRRRWLQQPARLLALAVLMFAFASAGVSKLEAHAHAHGHAPHTVHSPAHDHAAPAEGYAGDQQPAEDEALLHVHCTTVVATAIPAMTRFTPVEVVSVLTRVPPARIALSNRPSEHFRPPIA